MRYIPAHCINKNYSKILQWSGCEWKVHANWNKEQTFFHQSFNATCNCPKVNHNNLANFACYAQRYVEQMRDDPN